MEILRAYIEAYLKKHPQIHTKKMDFIIRELAPTSTGLPVELYVFTKTTKWNEYERIQAEIIDHLLTAAAFFNKRLYQEPAGADFASALRACESLAGCQSLFLAPDCFHQLRQDFPRFSLEEIIHRGR